MHRNTMHAAGIPTDVWAGIEGEGWDNNDNLDAHGETKAIHRHHYTLGYSSLGAQTGAASAGHTEEDKEQQAFDLAWMHSRYRAHAIGQCQAVLDVLSLQWPAADAPVVTITSQIQSHLTRLLAIPEEPVAWRESPLAKSTDPPSTSPTASQQELEQEESLLMQSTSILIRECLARVAAGAK
jgi:hypothetical protein